MISSYLHATTLVVNIWTFFYSGCTTSVTPKKSDFVGDIKTVDKVMQGLSSTTKITGEGTIKWKIRDDFGVEQAIEVKWLLVPESKVRLFSPHSYFEQVKAGEFKMNCNGSIFTFFNSSTLSFKYSAKSNLPIAISTIPEQQTGAWGMNAYIDSSRLKIYNA